MALALECRRVSTTPCRSCCWLVLPPGRPSRLPFACQIPPSLRHRSHYYLLCGGQENTPFLNTNHEPDILYAASCKSQCSFFLQIRNSRFRKVKTEARRLNQGSRIYDFLFHALPLGRLPVHCSWSCPYTLDSS